MSRTIYLILLLPFSSTGTTNISNRVVNGTNALNEEFPYAVSIRYYNQHNCGGSIIADKWVLTAAHCVFLDFINVSSVLYGTVFVQDGEAPDDHVKAVVRGIVNEGYTASGAYLNDIGLLQVNESFVFSRVATPVKLPFQGQLVPRNKESILVGWGYNETEGTVMPVLQKADITIFEDSVCEGYFPYNYSRCSHVCAGIPGGGRGQCSGDSGGALTVDGVIHGIVSWSDKPCTITPGIMTRVASFRQWIYNITSV